MSVRNHLGARERVEIVARVLGGESTAREIAEDFDVCDRYVVRLRAKLRREGFRVRVPEQVAGPREAWAETGRRTLANNRARRARAA